MLDRLVAALHDAQAEDFARLPWADDHIVTVTEIAQALAHGGGGPAVLDRLVETFDTIDSISALGLVEAALLIASSQGEGLTDELRLVLRGLAHSDKPWAFDVNLREILDDEELPTTRDEILELAEGE